MLTVCCVLLRVEVLEELTKDGVRKFGDRDLIWRGKVGRIERRLSKSEQHGLNRRWEACAGVCHACKKMDREKLN